MFERLDADARRVTDVAIAAAHELGHGWLGTEHVLLGALTYRTLLPATAQQLLPEADEVRRRLVEGIRPARPGPPTTRSSPRSGSMSPRCAEGPQRCSDRMRCAARR